MDKTVLIEQTSKRLKEGKQTQEQRCNRNGDTVFHLQNAGKAIELKLPVPGRENLPEYPLRIFQGGAVPEKCKKR